MRGTERAARAARTVRAPRFVIALAVLLACPVVKGDDLVSLGKVVDVAGQTGTVVSIGGDVRLTGRVRGDVVVVGADATLAPGARVDGDLLALGGTVRLSGAPGTAIGGRLLTVASLEAAFLAELETSPLRAGPRTTLLLAFRLFLLFLWLVAGFALLRFVPRPVSSAAGAAQREAPLAAALGVAGVLTGLLSCALFLVTLPAAASLTLTAAVLAALGAAKVFGLVALSLAVGRVLVRRASRGSALYGDPAALAVGLLGLGLVSLLPVAGKLCWAAASLVGIGLSLAVLAGRKAAVQAV